MAERQILEHNDAYFTAESRRQLRARALGENVARNGSADDAHAALMASPGHRANLMSDRFSVVGIAVVRDEHGSLWITQSFLEPVSEPASVATHTPSTPASRARRAEPASAVTPPAGESARPGGPATATTDDIASASIVVEDRLLAEVAAGKAADAAANARPGTQHAPAVPTGAAAVSAAAVGIALRRRITAP